MDTVGLVSVSVSPPRVCLIFLDSTRHVCLRLAAAPLSPVAVPSPVELHWACSVLWSDWLAPFVPQLLTDLSEFVDLTSPAAPASAQTQRLPPKPPPTAVSTRAAAALLVSGCADRPVRTREASSMSAACSLTGPGNLTGAAAWTATSELRTNTLYISVCSVSGSVMNAPTRLVNAALRAVKKQTKF